MTPTSERVLPIFPLNLVMFPTSTQKLHVFEKRYRLMMEHCINSDYRFGIVLIKQGEEVGGPATPFDVGTVGYIDDIKKEDDGRMYIRVRGEERFNIVKLVRQIPFLEAKVALLNENENLPLDEREIETVKEMVTGYARLRMGVHGGWAKDIEMPHDALALSWYVPELLSCNILEKQRILEMNSISVRLRHSMDLLGQETEILKGRIKNRFHHRLS